MRMEEIIKFKDIDTYRKLMQIGRRHWKKDKTSKMGMKKKDFPFSCRINTEKGGIKYA